MIGKWENLMIGALLAWIGLPCDFAVATGPEYRPLDLLVGYSFETASVKLRPGGSKTVQHDELEDMDFFWVAPACPALERQVLYCRTRRSGGDQAFSLATNAEANTYRNPRVVWVARFLPWTDIGDPSDEAHVSREGEKVVFDDRARSFSLCHRDPRHHGVSRGDKELYGRWHRAPEDGFKHDDSYRLVAGVLLRRDLENEVASERIIWLRPKRPDLSIVRITALAPRRGETIDVWIAYSRDALKMKVRGPVYHYNVKNR